MAAAVPSYKRAMDRTGSTVCGFRFILGVPVVCMYSKSVIQYKHCVHSMGVDLLTKAYSSEDSTARWSDNPKKKASNWEGGGGNFECMKKIKYCTVLYLSGAHGLTYFSRRARSGTRGGAGLVGLRATAPDSGCAQRAVVLYSN